ncbi:hypothetical protein GYN07_20900 [Rhizobium leguminosarum bv. viciae 248]|uniref:hypothetical protein n=1 Tax=Rhizobium leguminosarum TaxID=384 RepID=UPI00035FDEC4|nr:hypothetical protein [Rhizobium leguminosarum]QHW26642.1 hypothetical protein GYN07_20900 [Rhizobium leguminosarum bv. viciae 248]
MAKRQKVNRTTGETIVDFLQLIKTTNLNWHAILHKDAAGDAVTRVTQQQILSIYYFALFDWLLHYQKRRAGIDAALLATGSAELWALEFCDLHERTTLELCSIFTTEEHMVMTYLRHHLVHGHVTAFFDHELQTFEIKAGKVVKGWSTPSDTNDRREKTTEPFGGINQTMGSFFQRFVQFPAMHWANLSRVSRPAVIDDLELCAATNSTNYTDDTIRAMMMLDGFRFLPEPPRVSIEQLQQLRSSR